MKNKIEKCEVCGNLDLIDILDLGKHPMCDDLINVNDDRICKEYPINISFCLVCKTAHQKYQIPKQELFPNSYHYRSRFTSDVLAGMKNLVSDCKTHFSKLENKLVLDIGCNDGSLLDFFRVEGSNTFGIEPTNASEDACLKGHTVIKDYLTKSVAKDFVEKYGKPDFITFTNVFAHIEDLNEVVESLKILMHDFTTLVVENHYLGAVIQKKQFDTFYHEHPRTYSFSSFIHIAKSLGKNIVDVQFPSRYGGNIRVMIGNKESHSELNFNKIEISESQFYEQLLDLNSYISDWKLNMKSKLLEHVSKFGRIKAKAFPGRAAILIKMLDLDCDIISEVYEKPGSMKIGKYVPGTRIPILSDESLFLSISEEKFILNLAWHISDEISNYLGENGFKGEIINIL
jgi:hypothetical protein